MKRFVLELIVLLAGISSAATLPAQIDTVRATVMSGNQTLIKTATVQRIFGQPVTVSLYKDVAIVQGTRVGILLDGTADSLAIPRCVYLVVTDQRGAELPGLTPTSLLTTDTTVAKFIPVPANVTSPCPQKSVRLADIPVPVPVFQSVLTGGIAPPGTLVIGGRP